MSSGIPRIASAGMTSCYWPRSPTSHTPESRALRQDAGAEAEPSLETAVENGGITAWGVLTFRRRQLSRTGGRSLDNSSDPTGLPSALGHRRNYNPLRETQDINERKNAAIADVSHYRVIAVADLVKERFGGNPFAARKAINQMKADGLVDRTHASRAKGRCLPRVISHRTGSPPRGIPGGALGAGPGTAHLGERRGSVARHGT